MRDVFERLFVYRRVLKRHREGPLYKERAAHLEAMAGQVMARGTLLARARYILRLAVELERCPRDHCFAEGEVDELATNWARVRVAQGRATGPRWPRELFRHAAVDFLGAIGRLVSAPGVKSRYDDQISEFIGAQRQSRWQSEATCRAGRWHVECFFKYLEDHKVNLSEIDATHVDAFFQDMAQRWGRISQRTAAKILRSWFRYCERRRWTRPGIAAAVLLPRVYRNEGIPLGPTWDEVGRLLEKAAGLGAGDLRDQAILRVLSVYALRSGEVRRLSIDDCDWQTDRIRIIRSKSGRVEWLPLEATVGNAIARYLRNTRPPSECRVLFLTLRAPYRPLSSSGLHNIVRRRQLGRHSKPEGARRGYGPHGLRHACARHLIESGRTFKETGDHLGHRSLDSTGVYAKVDLVSLRRVAMDDLGGLTCTSPRTSRTT